MVGVLEVQAYENLRKFDILHSSVIVSNVDYVWSLFSNCTVYEKIIHKFSIHYGSLNVYD